MTGNGQSGRGIMVLQASYVQLDLAAILLMARVQRHVLMREGLSPSCIRTLCRSSSRDELGRLHMRRSLRRHRSDAFIHGAP